MLFGVIVLVILVIVSWFLSQPFDRWWLGRRLAKHTSGLSHPRQVSVPLELAAGQNAFKAVGFEEATTIQEPDGSVHAFLLGDGGRVIGEVAMVKSRHRASTIDLDRNTKRASTIDLDLTSSLAGHRGLLATSNSGLGLHLWPAELRQVFPGATVANLLQHHRDALEWLERQGITADPVTTDDLIELRTEFLKRSNEALARSSSKSIRQESMRAAQGRHAYVGPLTADADLTSRLKRFWDAIAEP